MAKLVVFKGDAIYVEAVDDIKITGGLYGWMYRKGGSIKGIQPRFYTKSEIGEALKTNPTSNLYFSIAEHLEGGVIDAGFFE